SAALSRASALARGFARADACPSAPPTKRHPSGSDRSEGPRRVAHALVERRSTSPGHWPEEVCLRHRKRALPRSTPGIDQRPDAAPRGADQVSPVLDGTKL